MIKYFINEKVEGEEKCMIDLTGLCGVGKFQDDKIHGVGCLFY